MLAPGASVSKQFCDKFSGKSLNKIYVLEVFAGSARLSKAALEQGFASVAIDHKSDRSCGISIQHYDLTDPCQLDSLLVLSGKTKTTLLWFGWLRHAGPQARPGKGL